MQTHKFISIDYFFLQQRKTAQVNLQKGVISTQKKPSCKKGCSPMQKARVKSYEIQVVAKE